MRAERAPKKDIKPFTLPSAGVLTPSWGWLWLRGGVTGKPGSKTASYRESEMVVFWWEEEARIRGLCVSG